MSENQSEERYIDPNSGAAPQPGGFVASVLPQGETAGEEAGPARPDNDPQAAERAAGEDAGNTPDMQAAVLQQEQEGQTEGETEGEQPEGETEGGQPEEQGETEAEAKDYSELLSKGVKDVQKYLEENPEEKDAVVEAEKQGQNRKTIVES